MRFPQIGSTASNRRHVARLRLDLHAIFARRHIRNLETISLRIARRLRPQIVAKLKSLRRPENDLNSRKHLFSLAIRYSWLFCDRLPPRLKLLRVAKMLVNPIAALSP